MSLLFSGGLFGLLASATTQAATQPAGNWLWQLFTYNSPTSPAHAILVIGLVAAAGLALGSIRIYGISLGIGGVLFSGLAFAHFYAKAGFGTVDHTVLEFIREFGLILFVYTIGMQVGPGFLASLRKQGLGLNIMAACIVTMGAIIAVLLFFVGKIPIPAAVGLFSGATTNTPSLAAAQQALRDVKNITPDQLQMPGLGYAVAYPFGIMGIIITMIGIRFLFRINPAQEAEAFAKMQSEHRVPLTNLNIEVKNASFNGLPLRKIPAIRECGVVISRILQGGQVSVALPSTVVKVGDVLHAVGSQEGLDTLRTSMGQASDLDVKSIPSPITYRRIIVTKRDALGKTVDDLNLRDKYNVNVTRIGRGEVEMTPHGGVKLQFGDTLRVVGEEDDIKAVAADLGDSAKQLNHPQVIPMFIGIALGVILGSWAFFIPGMPAPVKLGLAGGPLLVAIILSRLGHFGPLVWYMPASANFMVRELGIVLFLTCVGLLAGDKFVDTLTKGDGIYWMGCACLITLIPLLIVGLIGRGIFKLNYMTLCGILAGSMTDPPALAFAGTITNSDAPSISYATVYPLTMLLRVFYAQAIVLFFLH